MNKLVNDKGFILAGTLLILIGLLGSAVFIAVPALQRNQRNGARQNDIAYVRAILDTVIANNGGSLPTETIFKSALKDRDLGYYQKADIHLEAGQQINNSDIDVYVGPYDLYGFTGVKCDNASSINQKTDKSDRSDVAWFYRLEGSTTVYCLSQYSSN